MKASVHRVQSLCRTLPERQRGGKRKLYFSRFITVYFIFEYCQSILKKNVLHNVLRAMPVLYIGSIGIMKQQILRFYRHFS